MSANGRALVDFGEHNGHAVHLHNHAGQDPEHRSDGDWCSGKHLCATCSSEALPKGTWFDGPRCARPVVVRRGT